MKLNRNSLKLYVGQLVTTEYHSSTSTVIRKITRIRKDLDCGSGLRVSADGGEPCPTCKRTPAACINGIDGAWFIPYKIGEKP